jgi:hypothetical protein
MPTQWLPSIEPDGVASEIFLVVADVDGTLVTADKVLTPAPPLQWRRCMPPALLLRSPAVGRRAAWPC